MKLYIFFFILFCNLNLLSQVEERTYFEIQKHYKHLLNNSDSTHSAKNKWLNRWLWNNRFEFDNNGNLSYLQPQNQVELNFNSQKSKNNLLSENNWTPLGPIDMPPTYEPRSCYAMGRINCIAFHPTETNTFWIGTPSGGIWKTETSGKNWIPQGDNLISMAISHIAIDPKNPEILYAATGDFDATGLTSGNTTGVIKSTDGGNSWEPTQLIKDPTFASSALRKVIIHPDSTNHILVAGRRGIWKTQDGGETWRKVCDSIITDLEINTKKSNILFAAMGQLYGNGSAGVLRTKDFGETWEVLNTGIPAKGEISRVELAIAPSYPDYIYVLNVKTNTNGFHSLYCSTNGGDDWMQSSVIDTTNNILGAWGGDKTDARGQGSYDLALIVDATDKNKIYTGGINIWMSDDMGRNWKMSSFWIYVFGESIHADHHYAAYNPLDKQYYWCNDGGVYRTKKILAGDQSWVIDWIDKYNENIIEGAPNYKFPTIWENLSSGLAITEFYRMSMSKNNDNVLAGGSQDNSCYYYNSGDWLNYIPNYDGMETMIDNNNTDIFYGVWQNGGLCKTTDGGKTIKTRLSNSITEKGNWITPASMDPVNGNIIYMGYRNLWKSTDGGETWNIVLNLDAIDTTSKNRSSLTIVKNFPNNSTHILCYKASSYYQDTAKVWIRVPGELWITQDGGSNWKKSSNNLPLDSLDISHLTYDRTNPQRIYASINTSNRLINTYLTTDGGETWQDISQPLPQGIRINTLLHQPSNSNILYAGTNKGVYYSDITTTEWQRFSNNLPNTNVNDLEYQESTGEIFAATYGRGIWKTNLLVDNIKSKSIVEKIEIFPNPVVDYLNIHTNKFAENTPLLVQIIDVNGYIVYEITILSSKSNQIKLDIPNGLYYLILDDKTTKYYGKFILKK